MLGYCSLFGLGDKGVQIKFALCTVMTTSSKLPKIILSLDGAVIKEFELVKERTMIGRRPYNDIVIDNLAISGEHALLLLQNGIVTLEDQKSTNGTHVNGKAVKSQELQNGDIVSINKYRLQLINEVEAAGANTNTSSVVARPLPKPALPASIKVLSGVAAGREMPLVKVVTTVGKPGVAVASITHRGHNFILVHVEGDGTTLLNGQVVATESSPLQNGDLLELAGTRMRFIQG